MTGPIVRPEPLREAVYARIVALITGGDLRPGAAVTEATLAKDLDVSRTPVREALLRLEADGVLRSALARGFVVKQLDDRDAAELYPILATLEGLAVNTSIREAFDLKTLHKIVERMADSHEPVRCWQLKTQFHQVLVAASGNQNLSELAAKVRTNVSRYEIEHLRDAGGRTKTGQQHFDILGAIEAGNLLDASQLIVQHWQAAMLAVLEWLTS